MPIDSTRDTAASTRRAEALRKQAEVKPKALEPAVAQVKTATIPDGFADSKLGEMGEIAAGISLGKKEKPRGFEMTSGFERPQVTPGDLSGAYKAGAEVNVGPVKVGVSVKATGKVELGTENGMTTVKVSGDVSGTVAGSVKVGGLGAKVSYEAGVEASYSVSMPEDVAKSVDAMTVNPFDPSTMPTGTVVKLEESSFTNTKLGASFKALSIDSGVREGEGVSIAIEKTGDHTVRVTTGPSETLDASMRVGLGAGGVSVGIGRKDDLDHGTLRSAEFDLSTSEGAQAYADFLEKGQLPDGPGPGVSGVTKVETTSMSSTMAIDAKMGDQRVVLLDNGNEGTRTRTTLPDGTASETATLRYGDNTPLEVTRAYDESGNERVDGRRYALEVKVDENNAELLNTALGQDGAVKPGQTATITFTEGQMSAYLEQTKAAAAASPLGSDLDGLLSGVSTPMEFAVALVRSGGDQKQLERMFGVADGADGKYGTGFETISASVESR